MNSDFVMLIAWVFGIGSTLLLLLRIYGFMTYTKLEETLDMMQGRIATFPMMMPAIISIVCWAWVLTS